MAIVQCINQHYYDDSRNSSCPYCAKLSTAPAGTGELGEQFTSYLGNDVFDSGDATVAMDDYSGEDERTVSVYDEEESHNRLTVGWLMCMNGRVRGRSYPFFSGRNFAGRGADMDLVLSDDDHISRNRHFSLVFDPMSLSYFLVPGSASVSLNGDTVLDVVALKEGDEILAGETRYLFIPFCKEGRVWE